MPSRRSLAAFISTVLASSIAVAQTSAEVAARRLLLERAEAARNTAHHAEALDLASRAGQIQMSPSVRLFIAEEEEQLGRVAEAFGSAERCLSEVETNTASRNREAVRERCRALQTNLRRRVGQVVVAVPAPAPAGLRVTVAAIPLNPALYGAPMVVTPGDVPVAATADGRHPWSTTVRVAAGATVPVQVSLEAMTPAATVGAPAQPPPAAPSLGPVATLPSSPPPTTSSRGSAQRTLAWVAVGGAVALVGGGVAMTLLQDSASDYLVDTANNCRGSREALTGTCLDRANTEGTAQTLSIVGYATGGALAVTSVVLFLTAPSAPRSVATACGVGPGSVGVSCAMTF